jgi:rhamnose utilization protein RhaD (predicted bifunctional aldolase and dehydrogenase)
MITKGIHLKQAREAMGFSHTELARALRLAGGEKQGEKRVREMEADKRDISGPVTVAVEALLRGFLPHDFKRDAEIAEQAAQQPGKAA